MPDGPSPESPWMWPTSKTTGHPFRSPELSQSPSFVSDSMTPTSCQRRRARMSALTGVTVRGGRGRSSGSPNQIRNLDDSLAAALEMSGGVDRSMEESICTTYSGASWSPGFSGRGPWSKRRSINDLSQSARMTPKAFEQRGLGVPFPQAPAICTIDLSPSGQRDKDRDFCLLPTPELVRRPSQETQPMSMTPSLMSPGLPSPRESQRTFLDRVSKASMTVSPPSQLEASARRSLTADLVFGSSPECAAPKSLRDPVSPIRPVDSPAPGTSPAAASCASACLSPRQLSPRLISLPPSRPVNCSAKGSRRWAAHRLGTENVAPVNQQGTSHCPPQRPSSVSEKSHTVPTKGPPRRTPGSNVAALTAKLSGNRPPGSAGRAASPDAVGVSRTSGEARLESVRGPAKSLPLGRSDKTSQSAVRGASVARLGAPPKVAVPAALGCQVNGARRPAHSPSADLCQKRPRSAHGTLHRAS